MKRVLCILAPYVLLAVILTALFLIIAPLVGASGTDEVPDWTIEIDQVVRGDYMSRYPLGFFDPPQDIEGLTCLGVGRAKNNGSPHAESDLFATDDLQSDNRIWWRNVEREPGAVTHGEGELVIPTGDQKVGIWVLLGPDGVFSGGIKIKFYCQPQEPETYYAYLPIIAPPEGAAPPPTPMCEDEALLASITDQTAELAFEPWPGTDRDFGIWGPSQVLTLASASGRTLDWEVSEGAQAYQYLTDSPIKGFVAYWPNLTTDWYSNPVVLQTHAEYHVRASFVGQDNTLCMVSGWFQVDPPETDRASGESLKPAGLLPVNWK